MQIRKYQEGDLMQLMKIYKKFFPVHAVFTKSDEEIMQHLEKMKEKFEMAIALFDSHLDKDSYKRAGAINGLGNYYLLTKDYDAAIKMFLEAIDKVPSYASAHNDLAIAYKAKMGEGGSQRDYWRLKAIEEWKKAVLFGRHDPSFSRAQLTAIEKQIQILQQS